MVFIKLQKKLHELSQSKATLLWLEESQMERVLSIKLKGERVLLRLANGTTRLIAFEHYECTAVGLQLWSHGKLGVVYRWDLFSHGNPLEKCWAAVSPFFPDDEPPSPPSMAA